MARFSALNGNITGGVIDDASAGSSSVQQMTLTGGSYTAPNETTGRFTVTFTVAQGSGTSAVYLIDANRGFAIDISDQKAQSGDVRTQQQTTYSGANLNGAMVFYSQGYEYSSGSVVGYKSNIYQMSGDGAGNLTVNQSYDDDGGTYAVGGESGYTVPVTFDSSNPGRATFSTGNGTVYLYMYDNNSALEMDASNTSGEPNGSGWFEPQSGTFTNAGIAGTYLLSDLPQLDPGGDASVGEAVAASSGDITAYISNAGENTFSWDQTQTVTYSWLSTTYGAYSLTGAASGGTTCVVISVTQSVCMNNTSSDGDMTLLEQ